VVHVARRQSDGTPDASYDRHVTTAAEAPANVRFKAECRGCGRLVSKHSRKALTWKCPHCKRVNPGPGLLEEMAKPPEGGRRRRTTRRAKGDEAAAAAPAASKEPKTPAAAPVRRKRKASVTPASPAGGGGGAPPASSPRREVQPPASPQPKRGLFDRIMGYGEEDEG
jgi:phage FluMu protein Com